jgi:hypothetical protein
MKKFTKILEAKDRRHKGGTPFSNGHRTKEAGGFLENRHYLIDLDMIIYDNDSVKAIVEKKYKLDSKLGNILEESGSFQRKMLLNLCEKIGAKLFVNITSEKKFIRVSNTGIKEFNEHVFREAQNKYMTYDSDDLVFVEFRGKQPAAIIKRMEDGINIDGLLHRMSELLNVNVFKVDDINGTGKIQFYTFDRKHIGSVDILRDESQRKIIEDQWKDIYQKMNLW